MSAAAKSWKVQDQDRRSNMVTSSVHAPAKKDGAGGCYTWGSAMDVADYPPINAAAFPQAVTLAPAPAPAQPVVIQQATSVSISDAQQFPSLGSAPTASPVASVRWAAPAPAVFQAPPVQTAPATTVTTIPATRMVTGAPQVMTQTMAAVPMQATSVTISPATAGAASTVTTLATPQSAPRVILGEEMMRQGVPTLDSTHPRNAFVRKPHHRTSLAGTAPAAEIQEAPAIDWTASGTTAFQQQVIHAVAQNPAHLGPYAEAKPAPTLNILKAMPSPTAYIPNPKLSKQVAAQPKFGKPQVMYQRGC
mmetsp:Transcript_76385/g.236539  ORF Transcript_76385/g.236539 Transcript_76385/m.236539 type:complete len:306 (+) Transcript_76385:103-1020(+)